MTDNLNERIEQRLVALETKIAYLEQGQNELSEVVATQQKELTQLTKDNRALIERLRALVNDEEIDPSFEKPPHY